MCLFYEFSNRPFCFVFSQRNIKAFVGFRTPLELIRANIYDSTVYCESFCAGALFGRDVDRPCVPMVKVYPRRQCQAWQALRVPPCRCQASRSVGRRQAWKDCASACRCVSDRCQVAVVRPWTNVPPISWHTRDIAHFVIAVSGTSVTRRCQDFLIQPCRCQASRILGRRQALGQRACTCRATSLICRLNRIVAFATNIR